MTRFAVALLFCLAAAAPAAAADAYYKWKDENGVWQYTKEPPKGRDSAAVRVSGGAALKVEPAPAEPVPGEGDQFTDRGGGAVATWKTGPDGQPSVPGNVSADQAAAIEQRAANCAVAQNNVTKLEGATPVGVDRDGDGEPEDLDADQRAAELQTAYAQVREFCQ